MVQVQAGYATALVQTTMAQSFTDNGMPETLTDANGNVTAYEYDGIDRLVKLRFPNPSGGGSSATDYEQFTYNANSVVTQRRLRDGGLVYFTYDTLSRVTLVNAPSPTPDVASAYDNFGRLTQAAQGGHTLNFDYDQLSRTISAERIITGSSLTMDYQYDLAGRRTRVTWPDDFWVQYNYDLTGAVIHILEYGIQFGPEVLAVYAYDNLGRRTSVTRGGGGGAVTTYGYNAASRLSSLSLDLVGTAHDLARSFTHNAAGQSLSRSANTAYDWPQPARSAVAYTPNGRNQYANVGSSNFTYDTRGNLTATGAANYGYDAFNRLTSAGSATLSYDPAGRLHQVSGASTTRFLYDGLNVVAEYNSSNVMQRRFVHGPGFDEPIVHYEGSGTTDRRWLLADERDSVVAAATNLGARIGSPNTYDEYGQPGASNTGRFQYTGQMWLPEASLYHYKARAYAPGIGRFLQTDPVLYAGGMNLYAYVGNDPINFIDPLGLQDCLPPWCTISPPIDVPAPDDDDESQNCPAADVCVDDPYGQPAFGGTRGANRGPNTEVDRAARGERRRLDCGTRDTGPFDECETFADQLFEECLAMHAAAAGNQLAAGISGLVLGGGFVDKRWVAGRLGMGGGGPSGDCTSVFSWASRSALSQRMQPGSALGRMTGSPILGGAIGRVGSPILAVGGSWFTGDAIANLGIGASECGTQFYGW